MFGALGVGVARLAADTLGMNGVGELTVPMLPVLLLLFGDANDLFVMFDVFRLLLFV